LKDYSTTVDDPEPFECVDCLLIGGRRVAVIVVTKSELTAPESERPVVVSTQSSEERPHTVVTEPLVVGFSVVGSCFETRSDQIPVELSEVRK